MSFLDDIRKQPQHIREIMFGFSVVSTLSFVGMVWYQSFEKDMYALLNPEEAIAEKFLAQQKDKELSILGNIGQAGRDLKAILFNALDVSNEGGENGVLEVVNDSETNRAHLLPLSEEK